MNDLDKESATILSFPESSIVTETQTSGTAKFSGVLSGPMWDKLSKLDSHYVDEFDWSVYDKLHAKFGDEQPRGGVVFKSGLKLANFNDSCSKCHYSFELDTYGRGCTHNCNYCYAKDSLTKHGAWNRPHPFPIDLSEIRKLFYTVFETDKKTKWREVMSKRVPLRIGSMSDSFMWMDQKFGVTYELLKILSAYHYPYVVFTRSDLIATEKYINVLRSDLCSVQFSISSNNEELTRKTEPGAPSIKRRFAALKTLNSEGYRTAVRINPLFPSRPDGYFTDEESIKARFGSLADAPRFDFFDIDRMPEFADQIAESGTSTLLAGFVRLTPFTINRMRDVTGTDLRNFFKPENFNTGVRGNTDKNYSDKEIGYYYKSIHREAQKRGLRFTTCYIGNGLKDYYQYQTLWSNKSDCCDIKGFVPAFKNTCQEIPWAEREKHAPNKLFVERAKEEETYYANLTTRAGANLSNLTSDGKLISKSMLRAHIKVTNALEHP